MFHVTLTDNSDQQRLDEERYIGLIEPLDMPYLLFVNVDFLNKRIDGSKVDIPFFAYLYGVGKSRSQPTDGSIPASPIIVWGVYTMTNKIEYANQCQYKTSYLSKIVQSLMSNGYKNVGAMVIDRISVKIREFIGDDTKLKTIGSSGVLGSIGTSRPQYITSQKAYSDVKKYFAVIDGKIDVTDEVMDNYTSAVDSILQRSFGAEDPYLIDQLELEEYYQNIRDDLVKYETSLNMNYSPTRIGGDIVTKLVSTINSVFAKDVATYRPHRQQGVEFCPSYDDCMNNLLSDYCTIYNPQIFEETSTLI